MNYEQLAFFNQQLAAMLREGIPLQGALRQLCGSMRGGRLRAHFARLEQALAEGTPLDEALGASGLPELYCQMVRVGVRSDSLPAVLTIVADHYRRVATIWARLKGVLFYPLLVLALALGLSLYVVFGLQPKAIEMLEDMHVAVDVAGLRFRALGPPAVLAALLVAAVVVLAVPATRRWVRWHVPPFRDASLAQLASSLALMLRGGCSLGEAVSLLSRLEGSTRAGRVLLDWRARLAEGTSRFRDVAAGGGLVPPLFVWLVETGGGDLAAGFERAAEAYRERAEHRTELMLSGALPVSVLVVSAMVFLQMKVLTGMLVQLMNMMQSIGG